MTDDANALNPIEAARGAVLGGFDALGDCRLRLHVILAAIERGHIASTDVLEAAEGLERQARRLESVAGQIRRAMTKSAALR
jgi:hypothetical protein